VVASKSVFKRSTLLCSDLADPVDVDDNTFGTKINSDAAFCIVSSGDGLKEDCLSTSQALTVLDFDSYTHQIGFDCLRLPISMPAVQRWLSVLGNRI